MHFILLIKFSLQNQNISNTVMLILLFLIYNSFITFHSFKNISNKLLKSVILTS